MVKKITTKLRNHIDSKNVLNFYDLTTTITMEIDFEKFHDQNNQNANYVLHRHISYENDPINSKKARLIYNLIKNEHKEQYRSQRDKTYKYIDEFYYNDFLFLRKPFYVKNLSILTIAILQKLFLLNKNLQSQIGIIFNRFYILYAFMIDRDLFQKMTRNVYLQSKFRVAFLRHWRSYLAKVYEYSIAIIDAYYNNVEDIKTIIEEFSQI